MRRIHIALMYISLLRTTDAWRGLFAMRPLQRRLIPDRIPEPIQSVASNVNIIVIADPV